MHFGKSSYRFLSTPVNIGENLSTKGAPHFLCWSHCIQNIKVCCTEIRLKCASLEENLFEVSELALTFWCLSARRTDVSLGQKHVASTTSVKRNKTSQEIARIFWGNDQLLSKAACEQEPNLNWNVCVSWCQNFWSSITHCWLSDIQKNHLVSVPPHENKDGQSSHRFCVA